MYLTKKPTLVHQNFFGIVSESISKCTKCGKNVDIEFTNEFKLVKSYCFVCHLNFKIGEIKMDTSYVDLSKFAKEIYKYCKYIMNKKSHAPAKISDTFSEQEWDLKWEIDFGNKKSNIELLIVEAVKKKLKGMHLFQNSKDSINCITDDKKYHLVDNKKCVNFMIIENNSELLIIFPGTMPSIDFLVNLKIGSDNFHGKMFRSALRFLFRNNADLYSKIKGCKKKIYLIGLSLGAGFATYILIFFKYILNCTELNIHALLFGSPPIIPQFLVEYISQFIINIAHKNDPLSHLSILKKRYKFSLSKHTYLFTYDKIPHAQKVSIEKLDESNQRISQSHAHLFSSFTFHKASIFDIEYQLNSMETVYGIIVNMAIGKITKPVVNMELKKKSEILNLMRLDDRH